MSASNDDPLSSFTLAACVSPESDHMSGTLDDAEAILKAHPDLPARDLYASAIVGDDASVSRFLAADPAGATAKGGPYQWDALTHLCFSKYLRLDRARSPGFVRAAKALLDAGADANTGFYSREHQPHPEFESVLYGAAGIAHDADLTRLLLDHGADPNDEEVPYHSAEGWDNAAVKVLLESGRLFAGSLATMLLRKADWHDLEGVRLLLEHGADPNRITHWGKTALHQAVLRDNRIEIIELLLSHGADPTIQGVREDPFGSAAGKSAIALAARRGRGDVLELLQRRGVRIDLQGLERLLAASARHDATRAHSLVQRKPSLTTDLQAEGGTVLAEFAGNGNSEGVRLLLDLGINVRALYHTGDGYFGIAQDSTALHVAAWRARHATVRLLLDRGAPVNVLDAKGRTPLMLAVRACVDSYWKDRRSPESVRLLLDAGASTQNVPIPCGYAEVDELLCARR